MKKLIVSAMAVMLCGGIALAAEKAAGKAACPAGKKSAKCTVSGTVEAVDAAAMKMTVKTSKGEVKELVLAADTVISGKAKTLAEIVVGSSVQVKMDGDAVKSVKVKKLPKAAKEAKAEKAEKEKTGK